MGSTLSILVTDKSAFGWFTVVSSLSVLLVLSGSAVSDATLTEFVIVPAVPASTVTVI
jgi:hypothetical protein